MGQEPVSVPAILGAGEAGIRAEAHCRRCWSYTALRMVDGEFECADIRDCDVNLEETRAAGERMRRIDLEGLV